MRIAIVYVYAGIAGSKYEDYAMRFLQCYHEFSCGLEHESVVVLNGVKKSSEIACIFSSLPNLVFIEHDNAGYDIGAFQRAAKDFPCDMMVFLGASTFFTRPGWLLRMATSFQNRGNGQFGAMGNRGNPAVGVWPHLRTTGIWMDPELMNAYPHKVTSAAQRYPWEHGPLCFTEWVGRQGLRSWEVTWTRELLPAQWGDDPDGFQRGSQCNLLVGDRMCESPYFTPRIRP